MDVDDLLEHFDDVKPLPSGGYIALCPAHEDRTASLKIDEGDDAPVLYCHAGCLTTDVLRAVGLTWRDLRGVNVKPSFASDDIKPRMVQTYDYTDAEGQLLYQVVRMEPKGFRQRRPVGDDWEWNLQSVERVPYRLPELKALVPGATVFVTEGEKCADAIAAKGANVTTNNGGAGKWDSSWGHFFAGLHVIIVADRDEPGRAHAKAVKASVSPYAASVRVVQAKVGKDAYDHLAAGYGSADFEPVDLTTRFQSLDLDEVVPPAVWLLEDLVCMGDATLLYGQPKAGKTWFSMGLAIAVSHGHPFFLGRNVKQHGRVLYVDEEMPRDLIADRLRRLGLESSRWKDNLRYLWRQGIRLDETHEILLEEAREFKPALIVIDNLTAMHRGTENDLEGIGSVLRDGVVPLARETGAAVLLLHHSTKSGESPRGHSDIVAAVDSVLKLEKEDSVASRFVVSNSDARRVMSGGKITVDIMDGFDGTVNLSIPLPSDWRAA